MWWSVGCKSGRGRSRAAAQEFRNRSAGGGAHRRRCHPAPRAASLLIDELANDNPPGSPREHRWQDVEALLEHGINVISAINLQYIAELQPEIEKLTGRRAPRSVPRASSVRPTRSWSSTSRPKMLHNDAEAPSSESSSPRGNFRISREIALLLAAEVVESQLQRYMDAHGIRHPGALRNAS